MRLGAGSLLAASNQDWALNYLVKQAESNAARIPSTWDAFVGVSRESRAIQTVIEPGRI